MCFCDQLSDQLSFLSQVLSPIDYRRIDESTTTAPLLLLLPPVLPLISSLATCESLKTSSGIGDSAQAMFKLSSMHLLTMTILVFFTLTKPLQVPIVTPNAKTFHATSKPTTKQLPLIQAEFHDPTHDPTELLSSFTNRRKSLSLLSLSTLSILSAPTPSQASDLKVSWSTV